MRQVGPEAVPYDSVRGGQQRSKPHRDEPLHACDRDHGGDSTDDGDHTGAGLGGRESLCAIAHAIRGAAGTREDGSTGTGKAATDVLLMKSVKSSQTDRGFRLEM